MKGTDTASEGKRPNIVLIMSDDMERGDYGFLGSNAITPTLDKLADEGVYFERAHVPSAVCTPSRYSLLTGQDPSRAPATAKNGFAHGHRFWNQYIFSPEEAVTIGEMLQGSGYRTGVVGKVHAMEHAKQDSSYEELLESVKAHGFDYAASVYPGNQYQYHNQEWITAGALNFIEQTDKEQPFFLYMSSTVPHSPGVSEELGGGGWKPDWQESVLTWTPAEERGGTDPNAQINFDEVRENREGVRERVIAQGKSFAKGGNTWLDDGITPVLQKLEELGIAEDTVVIYLNDHGNEGAKWSVYEAGTNVPLMIYWKGKTESLQDSEVYAQSYDIVPTILDLAQVAPPEGVPLDGQSLVPILEGQLSLSGREYAYTAMGHNRSVTQDGWKYVAFRLPEDFPDPEETASSNESIENLTGLKNNPWKYPHYLDADQLYDLSTDLVDFDNVSSPNYDPHEEVNLADDAEYQTKLVELQTLLAQHLIDLPGSFGEFKFEVSLTEPWQVDGDLDLSAPYNAIALEAGSLPTANEYLIMKYTGELRGEFEFDGTIQELGYRVDDSTLGEVKLVREYYVPPVSDDELVMHLDFDQAGTIAVDYSPNGQDNFGQLVNDAQFQSVGGNFRGVIDLAGTGLVSIGGSPDINSGQHNKRTVALWFKADDLASEGKQVIYEQGALTRGLNIYLDGGRLYVGGWNLPAKESNWAGTYLSTDGIAANTWHHVSLVLDVQDGREDLQPEAFTAYLDGIEFGADEGAQLWGHYNANFGGFDKETKFHDGNSRSTDTQGLAGNLDDVRLYNRALTDEEIVLLASRVIKGDDDSNTLVGGGGNDTLSGGNANDELFGEAGNDQLRGGEGDDLLRGGLGNDTFVLAEGEGTDSVTDFEVGTDFIGLAAGLTFDQLTIAGANSAIIDFQNETLTTLEGVTASALDKSAFVLV